MEVNKISLSTQIKKEIGNRILFCAIAFLLIIFVLTIYDMSISVARLRSRVNDQVRQLEDFAINQIMIDNMQTIDLKLQSFNEHNNVFKIKWISMGVAKNRLIVWHPPFSWGYDYPLGEIAGFDSGYFQITGSFLNDNVLLSDFFIRLALLLIFMTTIFSVLYPLAKKIPETLFVKPINRFLDLISHKETEKILIPSFLPIELEELETKILSLLNSVKEHERHEAAIRLGNIAAQVAHDIRSPLAALNAMIKSTDAIPEPQRIMIRNATQRINDIANNLLTKYRKTEWLDEEAMLHNQLSKELIFNLLDHIVSEKRVQYEDSGVSIHFHVEETAYGVFAEISAMDFKRVMSNLINNAIEAVQKNGVIHINLKCHANQLSIEVIDSGCGMSQELQNQVFQGGVTQGKKEGTGIGLSSSKALVKFWGGSICLQSEVNQGTTVIVNLPVSEAASWFLQALNLSQGQTVVILDDTQSIHDIWRTRFEQELPADVPIYLKHYFQEEELAAQLSELPDNTLFLVDYELGKNHNGVDVIKALHLAARAVLVTSRDEETHVRSACQHLGIKILPKTYLTHVPLNIIASVADCKGPMPDLVFVDGDKLVTDSWRFLAEFSGKSILTFNTIAEARKVILTLKKDMPIYLDVEISEHEKGEMFSKELHELGFTHLYLATGYPKENFKHCTWLKGIIGKEPPFG